MSAKIPDFRRPADALAWLKNEHNISCAPIVADAGIYRTVAFPSVGLGKLFAAPTLSELVRVIVAEFGRSQEVGHG